jgi:DNA-binding LacI/PurR family transcriptional regulator
MCAALTIYDIATEAGVSPATVSRVLTNNARVSDEKRRVIERLIQKYQFKPNAIARGLSTSTRVLGLLVADIRNPYYAALAVECEKAANERGYTVLLSNMLYDHALEDEHLEKFCSQRVEAIIQIGRHTDDLVSDPAYVRHVRRITRTIPFITSGKLDGLKCFSVRINHAESMKMVMAYLVSLGHRKIALVGGEQRVQSTCEKRLQYRSLLEHYGLPVREDFMLEGNYDVTAGYAGMERLLKIDGRPTAVIAINDECALGAILAVQDRGLSVPGDISIVGYDNTFLTTLVRPTLTSVDYNYPHYGKTIIDIAVQAAQKKEPPREVLIDPVLIERESCAPPRAGAYTN